MRYLSYHIVRSSGGFATFDTSGYFWKLTLLTLDREKVTLKTGLLGVWRISSGILVARRELWKSFLGVGGSILKIDTWVNSVLAEPLWFMGNRASNLGIKWLKVVSGVSILLSLTHVSPVCLVRCCTCIPESRFWPLWRVVWYTDIFNNLQLEQGENASILQENSHKPDKQKYSGYWAANLLKLPLLCCARCCKICVVQGKKKDSFNACVHFFDNEPLLGLVTNYKGQV